MTIGKKISDIFPNMPFGRLTTVTKSGNDHNGNILWLCLCECGNKTLVTQSHLRSGHTSSCGCLHEERFCHETHGMSYTKVYYVWKAMLDRCYRVRNKQYMGYGGRGIIVCRRWMNFENFMLDIGDRPTEKHTLERRDNNGHYTPNNCYWATRVEQNRNKRNNRYITIDNVTLPLASWCEKFNIDQTVVSKRLRRGWSMYEALTLKLKLRTDKRKGL